MAWNLKGLAVMTLVAGMATAMLPAPVLADPGNGGGNGTPAPTPEQVARRSSAKMRATAELACRDIRAIAFKTAQRIVRMVRAGATSDQIIALGADAVTRINTRATNASNRIAAIKADALARIADLGGNADAEAQVNTAATNNTARVNECKDNNVERVNNAVTRATTPSPVSGEASPVTSDAK